jgi:hypothetical protein
MGFHAPGEAARVPGDSINFSPLGQLADRQTDAFHAAAANSNNHSVALIK